MAAAASVSELAPPATAPSGRQGEIVVAPAPPADDEATLSISEAARLKGVSHATLLRRIDEGTLPAFRDPSDGRSWRLSKKVVLEIGPLRKRSASERRDRGEAAALMFPLFRSAMPLDEVAERLRWDPAEVRVVFAQWCELRALTDQFFTPGDRAPEK
jgi:excisionase family DNA binding protein